MLRRLFPSLQRPCRTEFALFFTAQTSRPSADVALIPLVWTAEPCPMVSPFLMVLLLNIRMGCRVQLKKTGHFNLLCEYPTHTRLQTRLPKAFRFESAIPSP